ncbi:MAG: hypothetical protein U0166_06500 [Acidobacteriota bacterium]
MGRSSPSARIHGDAPFATFATISGNTLAVGLGRAPAVTSAACAMATWARATSRSGWKKSAAMVR